MNKKTSNIWCTLVIPYSQKKLEDQVKIKKAVDLLRDAGIDFDSGTDGHSLDIELDWSLNGAYLIKSNMRCMYCKVEGKELKTYDILLNDKTWENYTFCCSLCAKKYQKEIDR